MSDCRVPMSRPKLDHLECLNGCKNIYCHYEKWYQLCRECWPCAECDPCADCGEYKCPYAEVDHA